jgi:MYXO-CTERM domain-containing protein
VLYEEANGDGGTLVRGIRIDAAGTVLDPGGFDVAPGSSGDVAAVRSGLWLVATAESLDGKDLIRGRFVGDTTVPPPPSNVELPVVYPDDALTDAEAGTRDAGKPNAGGEVPGLADAASDTAIDGAAPPAVDASDVELSEPVGTNLSGGCSCRVGRGERAVPLTWFAVTALVIGAMGRRRDQPGR